jgi:hypothetical protein
MDLNHIELPASVVADLYRSVLLETAGPAEKISLQVEVQTDVGKEKPGLGSLGNNRKNILILLNEAGAVHLPDRELNFLTGILTACKLSLDDVAIINLDKHKDVNYKDLVREFKSRVVLLFNIAPAELGLPVNFPHYQVQPLAQQTFLAAPSLGDLENDRLEKSKLWVSLKRLFNI